jgi:ribose-phosphate pyrophosphokinase
MAISYHARDRGYHVTSSVTPFTFPGGERHFKGTAPDTETSAYCVIRGSDANDYIAARLWAEVIKSTGGTVTAVIPYLPGARADRGTPFAAAVYADLINGIGADLVLCFDPHSPVMPALVNNLEIIESARLLRRAIGGIDTSYTGIIAPDAGAAIRAGRAAGALHLPLYTAGKHRDFESGVITGFHCEPLPADGKYLIVDDVCDGGRTFLGLAGVLGLDREQLGLFVSHGIFSGHAADLNESFSEIITTDSHPNANNAAVGARVINVLPYMIGTIA